jgi:two-component system nitrogen regulation sensor histidine kinase NtrY
MRPVLLARADGHDQPRVGLDAGHDFVRAHLLDAQRTGSRFRLSHLSAVETQAPASRDWRGAAWIVASSIALIATSRWLSATAIEYLVLAAIATVAAGAAVLALPRSHRRWAAACTGVLAIVTALGLSTQGALSRLEGSWPAQRERLSEGALRDLQTLVLESERVLRARARQALAAPVARDEAFRHITAATVDEGRGDATVLYRGDSAFAWSGRPYVAIDSVSDSVGVTSSGTPFYLALYVVEREGAQRAVAARLLYAASPADRMVQSIGADAARRAGGAGGGIAGYRFVPARDSATLPGARGIRLGDHALFAARAELLTDGEVRLRLLERARLLVGSALALALACFIVAAWRAQRRVRVRILLVGIALAAVALTPLSAFSNYSRLFDPTLYFTSLGGPLTANAAALALTSALVLLTLLAGVRRQARLPGRRLAVAIVVVVTGLGPFLLRDLARGIQIPSYGVSASLWLIWEVPLFLAAVSVILAGAAAGSAALGRSRGLPPIVGPLLAVLAAIIAPIYWMAPAGWPWWYAFLWVAAVASLAVSRRSSSLVVAAATVAALGATTLVWGATTRARVRLAEQDIATLGSGDLYAQSLAQRLGAQFAAAPVSSRRGLLETYATSELAAAAFPTWLAHWSDASAFDAALGNAPLDVPIDSLRQLVIRARATRVTVVATLPGTPALEHAVVVPTDSGVVSVVVGPKSVQIPSDPFARLLGLETPPDADPPYTAQISPLARGRITTPPQWRRQGNELHGDWIAASGRGASRVHAEVDIGPLFALVQRGTLIVLLNLGIVGLLWLTSVLADGIVLRWMAVRRRQWARSYRLRLTFALFAFFMVPAIAFAVWSYQQLSTDAARARQLLVRETLRSVAPGSGLEWLSSESRRLGAPLLAFTNGALLAASDTLLEELAPIGRRLGPDIAQALFIHNEASTHRVERVGDVTTLFGYREIDVPVAGRIVLAAPARADELALGRRARDLGVLVLFATAIGALAALWLSGIAARQLARPIGSLRRAALALAGGEREPALEGRPTVEFLPVFAAFRRMVSDLNASRSALEEATRRTATVLRNVASGVIAIDQNGVVTLANPRADALLGVALPPGTRLSSVGSAELAQRVSAFLASDAEDEDFEMPHGEQQWRGRLTRLNRGGAVVTVDDVSEIARAERVLAWGEMARQVAHEIKNPLTPIRLGVQHLRRARQDSRVDFDRVLEKNVERILEEIDRLDEIARAFSRYGQPPEQRGGAEPTDVAAVLRDLVGLETMGEDKVKWTLLGADRPMSALGRRDELREVLLNVFENARLARSSSVVIDLDANNGRVIVAVQDDGQGIPKDVLPRIFEPHFSTRTSGSGLGLAISRRVIESWGGTMQIESAQGKGTRVSIELIAPSA